MKVKQFQWIDSLKGIAVLGVISVHCLGIVLPKGESSVTNLTKGMEYFFNYGQLGVQLFFMASAITLFLSTINRKEPSWKFFFIRRFFRIWPLYCCGIILYVTLNSISEDPQKISSTDILLNVLLANGLSESANNSVVPGGWSIGTEVIFYCLFPILFKTLNNKTLLSLFTSAAFLILTCLAIEVIGGFKPDVNVFYYRLIINQLSVFIIGACTFRLLGKKIGVTTTFIGIALIVVSCYLFNQGYKPAFNLFFIPILACTGFSILIIKFQDSCNKSQSFIWRYLAKLGKVSYSAYLLHFAVIWFLAPAIRPHMDKIHSQDFSLIFVTVIVTIATFLVASISYRWIEKPAIRLGEAFIERLKN